MTSINTKITTPGTVTTTSVPTTTVTVTSTQLTSTTHTNETITYTPQAVTGSSITATANVPTAYNPTQTFESPRITELRAQINSNNSNINILIESKRKIQQEISAGHKEINNLAKKMNERLTSPEMKASLLAQIKSKEQALARLYDNVAAQNKEILALEEKNRALQAELDNLLNNKNNNINTPTVDISVTSTADNIPTETTSWVQTLDPTTTTA